MKVPVICPDCASTVWTIVLIDAERLELRCFMCPYRADIKPAGVKLVMD